MNFTLNIHSELWQNIQISRFQPNTVESWIIKCSFVLFFCKSGKKLFSFNFVSLLALYLFLLYKVHKKLWQTRHWLLWEQNCVANAENLMGFAFTCEWLCNIYLLHFYFIFSHCCLVFTLSVTIDPHECAKNICLFISYLWKKKIVLCWILFSSWIWLSCLKALLPFFT